MKRTKPIHSLWMLAAWLSGFAALGGCGGAPLPSASEPQRAREVLTTALDAWKRGDKPETLVSAEPSVRVLDREWTDGSTLVAYQLKGEGQPLGLSIQQAVALELKNPKGRALRKEVNYVVTTGAKPMVARQDIDD